MSQPVEARGGRIGADMQEGRADIGDVGEVFLHNTMDVARAADVVVVAKRPREAVLGVCRVPDLVRHAVAERREPRISVHHHPERRQCTRGTPVAHFLLEHRDSHGVLRHQGIDAAVIGAAAGKKQERTAERQ